VSGFWDLFCRSSTGAIIPTVLKHLVWKDKPTVGCGVGREQLWSWIDRTAPELDEHTAVCPECRALAEEIRAEIDGLGAQLGFGPPPLPEAVGPFAIRRLIGEGGQALVYEAEQDNPQRRVALKVLRGGHLASHREISQFQREVKTLARLHHPSIVTVYQAGRTTEGQYYIAMELVDGQPLDRYVALQQLSLEERIDLCQRICASVQYAHEQGVIHRDLKPSNILVQQDGIPRILDFGIARLTHAGITQETRTRSGVIKGTPRYMSPEQLQGAVETIDHRSDVYALGVILFEVLTGESPFAIEGATIEAMRAVGRGEPKRAGEIDPRLRGGIEAIIGKALESDPSRRYPSVHELGEDLRRYLAGTRIAARPMSRLRRFSRHIPKRRLAAVVGFAAVSLLALIIWNRSHVPYDPERAKHDMAMAWAQLLVTPGEPSAQFAASQSYERFKGTLEGKLLGAQLSYFDNNARYSIRLLNDRLMKEPSCWPCRLLMAEVYEREGRIQEGKLQRDRVPPLPDQADVWSRKSLATLDPQSAMRDVHEALRCDPDHVPSLERKLALLAATGDTDGALDCAKRLVELNAGALYWSRYRGNLLILRGAFEEALGTYDYLLRMGSTEITDFARRGQIERRLRRYDLALADFTKAISIAKDEYTIAYIYSFRGTVQWILGSPDAAVADYRKAAQLLPTPTYATIRAAIILKGQGRRSDAEELLRELRAWNNADSSSATVEWLHSIASCVSGDLAPEALVAQVVPNDKRSLCEACYYAGEVCLAAGSFAAARMWFQRCLDTGVQMDPNSPADPMSEYELAEWRLRDPRLASGAVP
jgi:serine/threonine protein kinase/tetratricopeptide (TPR) repeat protein